VSLADVIAELATGTYMVSQPTGSFVAGRWVSGAPFQFQVTASVQPASGKELDRLPEGFRTREVLAVYTATELRVGAAGVPPDRIEVQGGTYEVQAVERWESGGYWKALAARV
jgi:hypothetical protein